MKKLLTLTMIISYSAVFGQNVGIGTNTPTAKLDINGPVKLEGNNMFEFGAGIAGKEVNAGKIGYNVFSQNALVLIGAGTTNTNRAFYFYAEGGTTFDGPVNVGGQIKVNGNSGAAGQVLTSNGSADPQWAESAYGNNTRFKTSFSSTIEGDGNMDLTSTGYNLNTSDISIDATSITINKTGLYRLNGGVTGWVSYPVTTPAYEPELTCSIILSGASTGGLTLTYYDHYIRRSSVGNPNYYLSRLFSVDMHLPAGTIVRISKSVWWDGSPSLGSCGVTLCGNLISQ